MDDDYVPINTISCEEPPKDIDDEITKNGIDVYQMQPIKNNVIVRHVGKFFKLHDILINKFMLCDNVECIISNTIYPINELKNAIQRGNYVNIINILIQNNDKKNTKKMALEFYINELESNEKLGGHFEISFYYEKNKIVCEKHMEFIDHIFFINKMITLLTEDFIIDKILYT